MKKTPEKPIRKTNKSLTTISNPPLVQQMPFRPGKLNDKSKSL